METQKKTVTSREIFGAIVALVVGLCSIGAWGSFSSAIVHPDSRNTVASLIWFSLLGIWFLLGAVVWRKRSLQVVGSTVMLVPTLLYTQTWYHVCFAIGAGVILFMSSRSVQGEVEDRVRFNFFRNVRAGSFMFIFGLSMVFSSAYFSSIRNSSWEELVPRFRLGEGTAAAVFKTVAYFYPEWRNLSEEGMTVDGFLLGLKEDESIPENAALPKDETTLLVLSTYLKQNGLDASVVGDEQFMRETYLRSGREQISELAERPVQGDEKIAEVFSGAMQHKIIAILSGEQASRHLSPTIVPFILAILLFFTLLTIGSAITFVWISFSFALFRLALVFGWLKLERIPREQETLFP